MNNSDPLFSIIVPTHNRADLLSYTLSSLAVQSFQQFEVLVIDDGGNDNSEAVVTALKDTRFTYLYKQNGERGAARNFGWQHARGRYVSFLDSDDIVYPEHLDTAATMIRQKDNPICFAQAYEIKDAQTGDVLNPAFKSSTPTINKQIINGNFLSCFGVFIKTDLSQVLRFEEDRRFAGTEDWLLWLQLASRYPFYFNNKVTGALLEHDSRSVLSFNEASLAFRTEFLRKRLLADQEFVTSYGRRAVQKIYAHMLSYTALHLSMCKQRKRSLHYLLSAGKVNGKELLNRRTLAIIKKIIFL